MKVLCRENIKGVFQGVFAGGGQAKRDFVVLGQYVTWRVRLSPSHHHICSDNSEM